MSEQTLPDPDAASQGTRRIRYGLLFMLFAAVIGYFASGSSLLKLPVFVPPAVMKYFARSASLRRLELVSVNSSFQS